MKHAYLIVAHTDFKILERLLDLLDYPGNDIYVHIDKKVSYDIKQSYSLYLMNIG